MKCTICSKPLNHGHIEKYVKPFCSYECIRKYDALKEMGVVPDAKGEYQAINWDLVEEKKKLNKSPRINWKAVLGMSLTRAIARFKAAGLTKELTYKTICFEHPELTEKMKESLRIGIAARWGEMATETSELNKARGK